MKFKLKKNWFLETDIIGIKNKTLIFESGTVFLPKENGEYHVIWGGWSESNTNIGGRMILSEDEMKSANDNGELLFEIVDDKNIEIVIKEIDDEDEDQIKSWRIQLDVKTTRKKLKEVQRIINEKVIPIL